jgi:bifunctional DNase/RNase
MIEMTVESVRINLQTSQRVVILKATKQERYLFIWIAQAEAYAIAIELQGTSSPRPLTHDLFINLMSACEIKVVSSVISDLVDDIFYSYIELEMAGKHVRVDARPSDVVAIAVRARIPIYVEDSVLDRAGVALEPGDSEKRNDAQMHDRERYDKFTERARKVLSLAQEEAQRFQHNSIRTEHLLLGLVREREGIAGKVITSLGVDLEQARKAVEDSVGRGDRIVLGEIGLTPHAKKVIELAKDEARLLNHHSIGTGHLLLGLLREEEGKGADVLERIGVNLEKVRAEMLRVLSEDGEESGQQQSQNDRPNQDDRDRFDKFTERARKVLSLAREEAQRFQHNYIGTEHLLLGLVREGEGVAAQVLSNLGVQLNKVRSAVEFIIGRGDRIVLGESGLTLRAKKVIELAMDEARRLNHHYIGTEHLLLGLVREGEGIAAGVLESLGVNLEKVRAQTIQALSQAGAPQVVSRSRFSQTHLIQSLMEVGDERFDTFTVQVSRVLSRAEEEAQLFQHDFIGTEHLTLALTRESKGVAASVLSSLGVELTKIRSAVEFSLSETALIAPTQVGLTPQIKQVIALAVDEARRLNHHHIGLEHLLLGLLREEKGFTASVLESLGVTLEQARIETIRELSQPAQLQQMEGLGQLTDALEALDTLLREKEAALQQQEVALLGGRYQLQGPPRQDGIFTTCRGWDTSMNRAVTIQVLRDEYIADPKIVTRFQDEAKAASSLQHPNIAQVYDFGQTDGTYYIVMELVDGTDLRRYLRSRDVLDVDRALIIAHDVALGLGAAHRRGMVHRDVKPQNVLVGRDGSIKLTNFGIASFSKDINAEQLTTPGMTLGTVQYYAPEQAQGEMVTPAADVYALGIVMYEMLTGRTPFDGDTTVAVAMQHIHDTPVPPSQLNSNIPPALEEIILRCLEKAPEMRFRDGSSLARALEMLGETA